LHVGSLMQIMILRWLQRCGHKPIILLGGFTTKIGDPSGKDKSRPAITDEQIAINKEGIAKVFKQFLQFDDDDKTDAIIVDNNDWLGCKKVEEGYLTHFPTELFLEEVASYFSVNEMIKNDSVQMRLERESHLSVLEFLYSTIQAYDFNYLNAKHFCVLQIGGSDQWGNITKGTELIRKNPISYSLSANTSRELYEKQKRAKEAHNNNKEQRANPKYKHESDTLAFGLTTPLLTTSSGAKMGKTADGAVWLNGDMLSTFDYYQFWRNCDDADVGRFLKLFTELSMEEIAELEALEGASINEAKKRLAYETTKLLHGEAAANAAAEAARKTFEEGAISTNLPTITLSIAEVGAELPAFKLLHLSGLCASGSEARKLIQGGGARINDAPFANETQIINVHDYANAPLKLSSGKKKHILVEFRD
jgi:tyrosyl-tRNA synthetase